MTYTDYLGQPINVGDTVLVPIASSRSSAAMTKNLVVEIIPLVNKNNAGGTSWVHGSHVRQDQLHTGSPAGYFVPSAFLDSKGRKADRNDPNGRYVYDESKAYVMRCLRTETNYSGDEVERKCFVKNTMNAVVITTLV